MMLILTVLDLEMQLCSYAIMHFVVITAGLHCQWANVNQGKTRQFYGNLRDTMHFL